jgi:glycosyltransferase involved in cell wall biosynthesis
MPKLIRITTVPDALYGLLTGQMKYMSENGFDVLMVSADGSYLPKVIENEQCRHVIIPLTRKITPFQDLYCLWLMIRLFLKEKPDIVHTHTPKAGLIGMLAAWICRVPVRLHTIAGLPLMVKTGLMYKLLFYIEKLTYFGAQKVLPNSQSIFDYMVKTKLCKKEKLEIIGKGSTNGVDLSRFNTQSINLNRLNEIKSSIEYNENKTYLLTVGRIVKDKGVEELIEAFSELQKIQNDIYLLMIGSFEDELDPISEKTKNIIFNSPTIKYIGHSNEVEYFMHLANFFVHASYREGFPNVVLQAAAMKIPIICSNIPGNIDIVTDENLGYVFEVKKTLQLSQKLTSAIKNPKISIQKAQKLYDIVFENFDRKQMHKAILNYYQSKFNKK